MVGCTLPNTRVMMLQLERMFCLFRSITTTSVLTQAQKFESRKQMLEERNGCAAHHLKSIVGRTCPVNQWIP